MSKVQIFVIYDKKCLHCQELLDTIDEIIEEEKIPCEVIKFLYENPTAINIAINNDITDLPGLVVGGIGKVCQGGTWFKEDIVEAIRKSWKKTSKRGPVKA